MKKYIVLISIALLLPLLLVAQDGGIEKIRVKKLSEKVNDATKHDIAPTLSGDLKVMYFVRYADKGDETESKSTRTLQDVWVTKRENKDAEWGPATKLPAPINNEHHNVVCGTNYDGSILFLSNAYEKGPNMFDNMKPGISISFTEDGGSTWSNPITIDLTGLKEKKLNLGTYFYYHIFEEGFHLLVSFYDSSKKNPSIGGENEDIYYCELQGVSDSKELPQEYKDLIKKGKSAVSDEEFKKIVKNYASSLKYNVIQHIGKTGNINSEGYETAPLLSHDSKKLYFTRQKGKDADRSNILVVERDNVENWDSWGKDYEPYKNLPEVEGFEGHIDSDKFDGYLIFEKEIGEPGYEEERREAAREILLEKGYFSSSRNSEVANLYMFEKIRTIPFQSELIVKVEDCGQKSVNVIEKDPTLRITVKDSEGKQVSDANITKQNDSFKVKIQKMGTYSIAFASDSDVYKLSAQSLNREVTFTEKNENDVQVEIPCLTGNYPIPRQQFYFAFDRYKEFFAQPIPTSPEDSLALRELGIELSSNRYGAGTANITSYTNKTGRFFSQKLSEQLEKYQKFDRLDTLIDSLRITEGQYKYIFISSFVDYINKTGGDYPTLLRGNRALTLAQEIYNRLSEGKSPSEKEALKRSIIINATGELFNIDSSEIYKGGSGSSNSDEEFRAKQRTCQVLTTDKDEVVAKVVKVDENGKETVTETEVEVNTFPNLLDFPNFRAEEGIQKIKASKIVLPEKSSK